MPGVVRYALSIVKGSSTRTDGVGPLELPADSFAELWFEGLAAKGGGVRRGQDCAEDGTLFVGREIDFVTEEKLIIPSA